MEQQLTPARDGYDVVIKILTIIKLLIQAALWGLVLGLTVWLLMNNPLPKLMQTLTTQLTQGLTGGAGR